MSLLLLFGNSLVSVAGSVVNIAIGAPTGSIPGAVVVAGAVVNIALAAPTGAVGTNTVVAGAVVNIALGAPTGSIFISPRQLRDPLGFLLVPSANQFLTNGPNGFRISPATNSEVF